MFERQNFVSSLVWGICWVLGAGAASFVPAVAQPGPEPRPGLRPSEPIRCTGAAEMVLRDRIIETSGTAVIADQACDLEIIGSHIVAGETGILSRGNSDVIVRGSYVRGDRAAMAARGNSDIEFSGSTIDGDLVTSEQGAFDDYGGNRVTGRHTSEGSTSSATVDLSGLAGLQVEARDEGDEGDEAASVQVGPEGVVVRDDEGNRVDVDDDVRIEADTGDEMAVVEDGRVRARDGDESVDVQGDWRVRVDSRYSGADTERILVDLGATREGGEIQLRLASDILFDFDSAAIRPDAAAELRKVAHVIRQKAAGEVRIVGHTDSKGTESYNLKLSQDRAFAVTRWLAENEGIPMSLMAARGMGESEPIAHDTRPDGSDYPEGRAQNRRVTIHIDTAE